MSKPVEVVSPDLGGRFNAIVVIKPERDKLDTLKLTISVKEVPSSKSRIPGEKFSVPKTRKIKSKKTNKNKNKDKTTSKGKNVLKTLNKNNIKSIVSKTKTVTKKSKSKGK